MPGAEKIKNTNIKNVLTVGYFDVIYKFVLRISRFFSGGLKWL